ncbi:MULTISPECIES: YycH family regulatory protein [Oceanobacillus]|uniref:Two-component system YycF/YycG regulatory protein YycH n=2 Tax=Oceanobacillus TaxID=182709 RepID=A0A0A1MBE1_9BACI|nr:two-component system activity regulator YycH [Oceanobacillus oncorhynchi]UUI39996.1 YycH family regulatory protein [Oceanobacillus oncorhynchi]CEI80338.1 Two-component system YycF/YycG regulatory protein YycH [Oceanobacillus oncorhynchi]
MKLETAKSLLLIILIGTSLVLTFGMWNYQAEYRPLNDVESIDEVDLGGEEQEISDLVKPNDVVFKMNGEFSSYKEPEDSMQFFEDIRQWELTDIQRNDLEEDTESGAEVEIIFPTEVPLSLFDTILNVDSTLTNNTNFYVDRFSIELQEEEEVLHVQFVSADREEVVEGTIYSRTSYDELLSIFGELTEDEYEEKQLLTDAARDIYIPKEKKALTSYTYTFDSIEAVDIRNIMFSNPNVVSVSETAPGSIMYRTDNRQLNIAGYGMRFIDVAERNTEQVDNSVLQQSLNNINAHRGFTGDYRLEGFTEDSIAYRMYQFEYPVVNNSYMDLSTIYQEWQNDQLSKYNRSLVSLNTVVNTSEKELRSGEEIMNSIQQNENTADIQDVQIAYRLTIETDDNGDYVLLEPNWYQKVNNSWSVVPEPNTNTQQNLEGGS